MSPLIRFSQWLALFIFSQSVDDARQFMSVLDPSLGKPLPEKDYGGDCSIYTPGTTSMTLLYCETILNWSLFVGQ